MKRSREIKKYVETSLDLLRAQRDRIEERISALCTMSTFIGSSTSKKTSKPKKAPATPAGFEDLK